MMGLSLTQRLGQDCLAKVKLALYIGRASMFALLCMLCMSKIEPAILPDNLNISFDTPYVFSSFFTFALSL
jgi:hypothetical protein